MHHVVTIPPRLAAAIVALAMLGDSISAQAPDLRSVARTLVLGGMIKQGDKVLITGSVRDAKLLEDLAIETLKVGGHPMISLWSDDLVRRSYDEVPAVYDSQPPALDLALVGTFDANIVVDAFESEDPLAGVPMERRATREKAAQAVMDAIFKRNARFVNLGNGLYPTATLSRRLGVAQPALAATFWRAAAVPAETLRSRGEALRARFAGAEQVTISAPNGTNLTFAVATDRAIISDGAITAEEVKRGSAAASTWLPAGELILPAVPATAEGKVVIDKMIWDGKEVLGLTLTYSRGRLTSMTAAAGLEGLKARYDAAGGAKDQFGFVDIGLNPEAKVPLGTGRTVWMAPGGVTVGLGDNRGFGGSNASDFSLATQIVGATVRVNGRAVVENGVLK